MFDKVPNIVDYAEKIIVGGAVTINLSRRLVQCNTQERMSILKQVLDLLKSYAKEDKTFYLDLSSNDLLLEDIAGLKLYDGQLIEVDLSFNHLEINSEACKKSWQSTLENSHLKLKLGWAEPVIYYKHTPTNEF